MCIRDRCYNESCGKPMSIEIKQHLKLSQQLVMTPQLQQAIKLLQLSRMELVDMVHEEMMENPVLEDSIETANEQSKQREDYDGEGDSRAEGAGETETAVQVDTTKLEREPEIKTDGQAVNEIDWENYLDN